MRLGGNAMVIRLKDTAKLFGITIIACCAVFVCTLFLSYNIDLAAIKDVITTEAGMAMYNAQVLMGKVIAAVSGGCLIATSVVMLLFYVKNYIGTHGKELGILKALGYSNIKIARHFWVFGLSVFVGSTIGFVVGYFYLPTFYQKQAPSLQTLIPELKVQFHPLLTFALVGAPTIAFSVISVLFAYLKLKSPVLDLLRERQHYKSKIGGDGKEDTPFLKDLRGVTLRSKKSLVFFVAFSAFCFSAMVQMSFSMDELASETFAVMVLSIGLILAFVTLFLSLSSVVKGNTNALTPEQLQRVLDFTDRTDIYDLYVMHCAIQLAFACCMRGGEVGGTQWERFSRSDQVLYIDRVIDRVDKKLIEKLPKMDILFRFPNLYPGTRTVIVLKQPKTEGSIRTVYIPETVAKKLEKLREMQMKLKLELGDDGYMDYGLIICQANGRPIMTEHLNKRFKEVLIGLNDPTINVDNVVFHSLRHTSTGVKLRLSKGDLKAVQGDGGWNSPDMVTKRYAHILDEDRRRLADEMEQSFYKGKAEEAPVAAAPALDAEALASLLASNPELLKKALESVQLANNT